MTPNVFLTPGEAPNTNLRLQPSAPSGSGTAYTRSITETVTAVSDTASRMVAVSRFPAETLPATVDTVTATSTAHTAAQPVALPVSGGGSWSRSSPRRPPLVIRWPIQPRVPPPPRRRSGAAVVKVTAFGTPTTAWGSAGVVPVFTVTGGGYDRDEELILTGCPEW